MKTRPYRPSNGSEGAAFTSQFCDRCEREREFRNNIGDACEIVCRTMLHEIGEDDYPPEWIQKEDGTGAMCTAFEPEKTPEQREATAEKRRMERLEYHGQRTIL